MTKIQVTVPVFIGGVPFAAGEAAEVDEYEARLLIGMGRAVLQTESTTEDAGEEEVGDEGSVRKGRKRA